MALMVSSNGRARHLNSTTGRGAQSGGSLGGDKKPGTVHYGPSWRIGNMGNYLSRAPTGCCNNTIIFYLKNSNMRPTQRTGYRAVHSPI